MKFARLAPDQNQLVEFFQHGLEALGAVCERTWYDRLAVVAEGRAAELWQPDGQLMETQICFPPRIIPAPAMPPTRSSQAVLSRSDSPRRSARRPSHFNALSSRPAIRIVHHPSMWPNGCGAGSSQPPRPGATKSHSRPTGTSHSSP